MKLLREPLLHFALGGALIFAGYGLLEDNSPATSVEPVTIGAGEINWLSATWSRQWLRQPSSNELQGLVVDLATEELFAREAVEMGLGEGDTIIRRRLAQKLKFMVEDTARLAEPDEAQLRGFYEAHKEEFQTPAKLSFVQVYFNPETHQNVEAAAKSVLPQLVASSGSDVVHGIGDRSLVDAEFVDVDEQRVTSIFGPEFSRAVFALRPGEWSGPVTSGYGDHLVMVEAKTPAKLKPFEEAHDQVVEAWQADQQQVTYQAYVERLRQKYGVVLEDNVTALLAQTPSPIAAAP